MISLIVLVAFSFKLKPILSRQRCRPVLDSFEKLSGSENHSKAPGLPQSEIAGNEDHDNNNTNDVKNIVHVSSSFLSSDRMTLSNTPQHYGKRSRPRGVACLTVR
jgi:hypothetical protein